MYFAHGVFDVLALGPNGRRRWLFQHRALIETAAVGPDGTVWAAGCYCGGGTSIGGVVIAIGPDGRERRETDRVPDRRLLSLIPMADGSLYAAGEAAVYAFDPSGHVRWRVTPYGEVNGINAIARAPDGTLYVASSQSSLTPGQSGRVSAISPAGQVLWQRDLPAPAAGIALGVDGTLYVTGGAGGLQTSPLAIGPAQLFALAPDGSVRWTYTATQTGGSLSDPAIGPDGSIDVGWSDAFLGPGRVTQVAPDGTPRWVATVGDARPNVVVDAAGTVYAGGGTLSAISSAGRTLWTTGPGLGAPVIGPDGALATGIASFGGGVEVFRGPAALTVSGFQATPARFRIRGAPSRCRRAGGATRCLPTLPLGTTLSFTLSKPADVVFDVRRLGGRGVIGLIAAGEEGPSNTLPGVHVIPFSARRGPGNVRFYGSVLPTVAASSSSNPGRLTPGTYVVTLRARAGRQTAHKTARMTIAASKGAVPLPA